MMGRGLIRKDRVLNIDPTMSPLQTVMRTPVEWLWPGRIVAGNLTLLVGDPDVGKSLLAMDLAARLSRGGGWPDGQVMNRPAGVVLLSAEDHLHYSVRPALDRAGADLARITTLWDVRIQKESGTYVRPFELKRDIDVLGKAIRSIPDCKLVVIDPLAAFLGQGTNPRTTLNELMKLASRLHVAVLGITHLKPGGRHALYRTMGAFDLTTAARGVWMVARDPANKERRLVLPVKNNLAGDSTGMAFTLTMDEGGFAPQVEWLEMNVETTADEALASLPRQHGPDPDQRVEAVEFLKQALADGPRLVKDVESEGWHAHCVRVRTLHRARKALRIEAFRKEVPGPWWMRLPEERR
jgi:putative DNA primase/helicase